LFFIAEVLLLQGLYAIKLTTEELEIKFFIAGILSLKGSIYRGFSVIVFFNIVPLIMEFTFRAFP
jgi:hypothetical protein